MRIAESVGGLRKFYLFVQNTVKRGEWNDERLAPDMINLDTELNKVRLKQEHKQRSPHNFRAFNMTL